ncbi:MAG: GWxTD domain-containing protein [Candidatus Aminicenantes bacterium]|nr:MAG: GWxTD domain-containing protein [Candidatus Aminicenantes bacterium]
MMRKRTVILYVFLAFWFVSVLGCRLYQLEKKLSPEYKEFFSKVRYIITKEERKIFLELPDSEKKEFQEDFWIRRDPDLFTDENEFKEEYFHRIDEANRLFHGGRPGWLQDRGRIYILFGPPSERHTYSMLLNTSPREIWYYGYFPVIFIDHMGTGDYKLESLNLMHLMELDKAQNASQELAKPRKEFFDFDVKTHINEENEVIVTLEINYKNIWFAAVEDRLETTIVLSVELQDAEEKIVLSETKEYPISILEDDIGKEDKIIIEYPLKLKRGTYTVNLELENKVGKEKRRKTLKLEVKRAPRLQKK